MQGKKNPKKPKVFDESLLWNSGKMFNFQLLGLVPCICTLWWWEQFLASSKDEVICHAVLLVMELSCSEAKWLDKGPLGGWWQEWPQFLVSGLCLGIEVFLKNKVKLGLCLRNVVTGGVSQWARGRPGGRSKSANLSWPLLHSQSSLAL